MVFLCLKLTNYFIQKIKRNEFDLVKKSAKIRVRVNIKESKWTKEKELMF